MDISKGDLQMITLFEEAVCKNSPASSIWGPVRNHGDNISELASRVLCYTNLAGEIDG